MGHRSDYRLAGPFARFAAFCLALLLIAFPATAQDLGVKVGWAGFYRPGEYTPLYITTPPTSPATASASAGSLEFHAWKDARGSVIIRTPVPLQAGAHEWIIPALMGNTVDGMGVSLLDAKGRIVATRRFDSLPTAETAALTSNTRLVAIASPRGQTAVAAGDFVTAFIDIKRLPSAGELYQSLDALVITGSTLAELTPTQSTALVAWARAGGKLIICSPAEGLAPDPTLATILPARTGELQTFSIATDQLTGRALIPSPTAIPIDAGNAITAYSHPVGLGKVILSPLEHTIPTRPALGKMLATLIEAKPRVVMEWPRVPDEPAQFPWQHLALALITLGLLLGPIEAIARRAHNLWPWRWWVLTGLFSLAAGVILHFAHPRQSLPQTPLSLTDIINGQPVSTAWQDDPSRNGFLHTLEPLKVRGTNHSHTALTFSSPTAATLTSRPPWSVTVGTHLGGTTTLDIQPQYPDNHIIQLLGPATAAWLETNAGIIQGQPTGTDWHFTSPPATTLPDQIAALRRLTPTRSPQLQARLTAGEIQLLWIKSSESEYARVILEASPPSPTPRQ